MQSRLLLAGLIAVWLVGITSIARADHFSTGNATAARFGVHEITLTGDGSVGNPFDTPATVTFLPPSGKMGAKSVPAFYDGGNIWRARVYVNELGVWKWSTKCEADKGLNNQSGSFRVAESKLAGRLLPHSKNPRQWMTEDGRWFLNLNDTAYFLLCSYDGQRNRISDETALRYVRDDMAKGITSVRCFLTSRDEGFNESPDQWRAWYFPDPQLERLRLTSLQTADHRLRLLLEQYPRLAIQLILFPLEGYARDDQFWTKMTKVQRERLLRNLVARFAAYPQLFWLCTNDAHYGEKFPNNNAMAREVGAYLQQHDPWQHPRSTGHARRVPFYFGKESWATYIHIEHEHDLGATECSKYQPFAKPIFLGEDRYEQDHGTKRDPVHMRYWQRRLFWAWLLSGGSTNYGGRWAVLDPYSTTGTHPLTIHNTTFRSALTGLDSVKAIQDFFADRKIEISDFRPDHALASDPEVTEAIRSPRVMRRGYTEFLIYHPAAAEDGQNAHVDKDRAARIRVDLRKAEGNFSVEWYRAEDGVSRKSIPVRGGRAIELFAPWFGADVVLRLVHLKE